MNENMEKDLNLIVANKKETIRIKLLQEKEISPLNSHLLGPAYWEASQPWPTNTEGIELTLLAQINFHEFSHLFNSPYWEAYPRRGILQFFINGQDDLWGLNFENLTEQKSWRIVFWPEPSFDKYKKQVVISPTSLPVTMPLLINFNLEEDIVGLADEYNFEKLGITNSEDELYEAIDAIATNQGHKIGGFATFTQSDPRLAPEYKNEDWLLLLQIDSDDQIMWGDCGVANWFIPASRLKKLDFSDVLYNWDCC